MIQFIRMMPLLLLGVLQCGAAVFAQDMRLPEPEGMTGDRAARIVLAGNAAFMHGDLGAAAANYRAALRQQPQFAIAYFNLGLVEAHTGQRDRGLRDMDRGVALAKAHRMSVQAQRRLRALRDAFAVAPIST